MPKRVSTAIAATGQPVKVVKKRASKAIVNAEKVVVEATLPIPDPVVATVKPVKAVRKRASKVIVDAVVSALDPSLAVVEPPVKVVRKRATKAVATAESSIPALEPTLAIVDEPAKVAEVVTQPVETVTPPLPTEENPLKPYQILNIFKQCWPKAFDTLNVRPLAIGIHKEIQRELPELSWVQLKNVMRIWCTSSYYLRVCTEGAVRYGLDGLPDGVVSAGHATQVKSNLQAKYPGLYVQLTKKVAQPKPLPAPKPNTQNLPKPKPIPKSDTQPTQSIFVVNVKSIKVTVPLKVSELPVLPEPRPNQKQEPVTLQFQCGDVTLTCTLNPKSFRKAMKDAHPDSTAVIKAS